MTVTIKLFRVNYDDSGLILLESGDRPNHPLSQNTIPVVRHNHRITIGETVLKLLNQCLLCLESSGWVLP
jgi:hypothetical protein